MAEYDYEHEYDCEHEYDYESEYESEYEYETATSPCITSSLFLTSPSPSMA